jgi:RNA polymerase sigma-70 factor, ECF subfamily
VFVAFFRRAGQGCYDIPEGGTAWKLLLVIAMNSIRSSATYYFAAKRDAQRTVVGVAGR